MLRRYGNDKVYRMTYQSGLQWNQGRRGGNPIRRLLRAVGAFFAWLGMSIASLFTARAGRRSAPPRRAERSYDDRRAAALDGEPVSLRGYTNRRRRALSFAPSSLSLYLRFLAGALAVIMAVSVAIAIPPIAVYASSMSVMVLDEDRGIAYQITTQATSVGELLDMYDFQLSVGDIVHPDRSQPLADGQEIRFRRAMSVSTSADGVAYDLRIQAGTVREALAMSGIAYGPNDIIEPPLNTRLTPGMSIDVTRVEYEEITQTKRLYFQKRVQEDSSLYVGETKTEQEGKEGSEEVDIRIVYHDGEEAYREEIGSRVIESPQHWIVREGTKAKVQTSSSSSSSSTTTKTTSSSGGGTKAASGAGGKVGSPGVSDDWYKLTGYKENIYWVFYGEYQYEKLDTFKVKATAYTHTGNKTASGVWPSIGTIAVDKSVIPMGTRLFVPGYGIGIAQDTGGAIKGNKIDVFLNTESECIKWGVKTVQIYVLGKAKPREL